MYECINDCCYRVSWYVYILQLGRVCNYEYTHDFIIKLAVIGHHSVVPPNHVRSSYCHMGVYKLPKRAMCMQVLVL